MLVSLELLPTNQKNTKVLDFSIVTSAYGHSKIQRYLKENSILYINPNKKRTDNWLSLNGLQLPVGENQRGSIRKITYSNAKVKIQNPIHMTQMQEKLYKAGVIDEYGEVKKSIDDTIDADYLAAVERGDMETAQRMVDEAAELAFADSKVRGEDGKLLKVYHGSDADFTVFDKTKGRAG